MDHGEARLALATVLERAGDTEAARAAAELFERKGANVLAGNARGLLDENQDAATAPGR